MLWEEHKIMGNTEICPPRHQLFVTQGLLDLEVVVLEKKKKKRKPVQTPQFHPTVENALLEQQLALEQLALESSKAGSAPAALSSCHSVSPCHTNWTRAAENSSEPKCHLRTS